MEAVLRVAGDQPLAQLVARHAVTDRLCVLLHVRERQPIERRRGRVEERERAERGEARLVAGAARGVADDAGAEADGVPAARPRQRVRELRLPAEQVRYSRL